MVFTATPSRATSSAHRTMSCASITGRCPGASSVEETGLFPLVPGLGAGILVSFGTERYVNSLLYGISPRDPLTVGGVVVLLTLVALAASYLPARQAARINPVSALRYE